MDGLVMDSVDIVMPSSLTVVVSMIVLSMLVYAWSLKPMLNKMYF